MKTLLTHVPRVFVVLFTMSCALAGSPPATHETAGDFPHLIRYELGEAEFAAGDDITIREVHGTKETITIGGTYCVEGTYTLGSMEEATLALFVTTSNNEPSPIGPKQTVQIKKGTGSFRLIKTMTVDGYLHVSFYPLPSGSGFGGVYFGQGKWVLRQKGFSYLDNRSQPDHLGKGGSLGDQISLSGPNRAMFEYLGDPVPPPANMEVKYTREGLADAIRSAAQKAGICLKKVEIDDSEYPYLVGVICEEAGFAKLTAQIKKMNGYEDQGSVGSPTCHTMSIVPWRVYPPDTSQRIGRRLTLRQQIFYDKISRSE